jgi:hypothetical protein
MYQQVNDEVTKPTGNKDVVGSADLDTKAGDTSQVSINELLCKAAVGGFAVST